MIRLGYIHQERELCGVCAEKTERRLRKGELNIDFKKNRQCLHRCTGGREMTIEISFRKFQHLESLWLIIYNGGVCFRAIETRITIGGKQWNSKWFAVRSDKNLKNIS